MPYRMSEERHKEVVTELLDRSEVGVLSWKEDNGEFHCDWKKTKPFRRLLGLSVQLQRDIAKGVNKDFLYERPESETAPRDGTTDVIFDTTGELVSEFLEGYPTAVIALSKSGMESGTAWSGNAWAGPTLECLGLSTYLAYQLNQTEAQRRLQDKEPGEFDEVVEAEDLEDVETAVVGVIGDTVGLKFSCKGSVVDCAGLAEQLRDRILEVDPPNVESDGFVSLE